MANITRSHLGKWQKRAAALQTRAKRVVEKSREVVHEVVRTTESGSAAFLFGMAQGRYGGMEVMGVPMELAAGVGLKGIAFFTGGDLAPHLHAFGQGALDAYLTTVGRGVGDAWKQKSLTGK